MSSNRAETLKRITPELVVQLTLYPTDQGGRREPIPPGWSCPCFPTRETDVAGWDGCPMLGDDWMQPGETRIVGYAFLSGREAAEALSLNEHFYIWERRIIGEAKILSPEALTGR
jgi:hypothetical protein